MKKTVLLAIAVLATMSAMAQDSFPGALPDPGGVPIVESILGLLGLGGAYLFRVIRKRKNED